MSENSGKVAIRLERCEEVSRRFQLKPDKNQLSMLSELEGIKSILLSNDIEITFVEGFIIISFSCFDGALKVFGSLTEFPIECYSAVYDEYGRVDYFASRENFHFSYEEESDAFELIDGYEERVNAALEQWVSILPPTLREYFN